MELLTDNPITLKYLLSHGIIKQNLLLTVVINLVLGANDEILLEVRWTTKLGFEEFQGIKRTV